MNIVEGTWWTVVRDCEWLQNGTWMVGSSGGGKCCVVSVAPQGRPKVRGSGRRGQAVNCFLP